ncbi:hypothetical protein HBH53_164770 [Parastagonospora nodorum]|nr:hypothetical protein HBH53_164770 [Parastagonospora nodorum]KAH3990667.1 hypothetical protein HBH52_000880 [Parastagonospora nodorum]KAH4176833.1 hypothetical protein HBH43_044420 [Parastagonospora nodorum]KAH4922808.1 hypothetical protein HBI79_172960 [Parastagonospora nodorum]KAH4973367.1 hypothetical protein HBI78_001050 [Parastagonospora nodorum]
MKDVERRNFHSTMNASYSPIPFQNFAMYSATRSMPLMLTHLPLPNCLSNNLPPLHPLLPILPRRTLISLPLHRQQRLPPCIKPRTPDQPRRRNERETLHPRLVEKHNVCVGKGHCGCGGWGW